MTSQTARAGGTDTSAPPFTGFPDAALAFYDGLEADNSKTYWTRNQDTYESAVRGPMTALLEALAPEFGPAKMFRPYRDVRFSADKSPYKTQLGAVVGSDGESALYVAVSADGLFVGGGYYQMAKDQIARYREAVLDDDSGEQLQSIAAALSKAKFSFSGETLLRAPRGIDPEHPRIELLRRKGVAAGRGFGAPAWLSTKRCVTEVAKVWRQVAPLNRWLAANVGPSTEPREERGRR